MCVCVCVCACLYICVWVYIKLRIHQKILTQNTISYSSQKSQLQDLDDIPVFYRRRAAE